MNKIKGDKGYAHVILAYNVFIALNEFYSEHPKHKLTKDQFMDMTKIYWDKVKQELNIKV